MAPAHVIPSGYTFLNPETLVTTNAKLLADELLKKAGNRDPDAFDMYIYNDFFSYGLLDLVDKTLTNLHSKIAKKDWNEAYSVLEALTVFNDYEGYWTQCDDGERVEVTNKVYGALTIAVLRALKKEGRLDSSAFPSLESLLKGVTSVGEMMQGCGCDSDYTLVSRAMARRLFKDKTEADLAVEKARRDKWIKTVKDDEEREIMERQLQKFEKDAGEEKNKPWYMKGKVCDEDDENPDFALTRAWKEYKAYLADVPKGPMRGPCWDIDKWTPAQKRPFEFAHINDNDSG